MSAFEASHAPLAACVEARLNDVEMARVAEEFSGTPAFARLIEQSPALFMSRDDLLAQVSAAHGEPAQQALRLLAGLREYGAGESSAATPGSMEQQLPGYHRVRTAVADLALAPLASIRCDVPDDLARQVVEARSAELLVEVSSAYAPFQACLTGAISGRPDLDGRFPELIVARGLDAALLDVTRRYLVRAVTASGPDRASREVAARTALQALGAYGVEVGLPGQPYLEQLRRKMAIVETMQLVASATDADCIPNESLLSWMEAANHENH